uniref:Archease domain-containing protein n=1 Tax=Steinernema glaseri TaxID=37863 RepID=A0A1I7YMD7_9BILA
MFEAAKGIFVLVVEEYKVQLCPSKLALQESHNTGAKMLEAAKGIFALMAEEYVTRHKLNTAEVATMVVSSADLEGV